MESDDDIELQPPSPAPQRKLKRLKKWVTPQYSNPNSSPQPNSFESHHFLHSEASNALHSEDLDLPSPSSFDTIADENRQTAEPDEDRLSVTRVSEFQSLAEDLLVNDQACSTEEDNLKKEEDDLESNDVEKNEQVKRKRKKSGSDGDEKKAKESSFSKKRAEKERLENLKNLRAETQRLLRGTQDASFKPVPRVDKPISSLLNKIRQRKLELLKKSISSIDDNNDDYVMEVPEDNLSRRAYPEDEIADKDELVDVECQEALACPEDTTITLDASPSGSGGSGDATDSLICETEGIACPMVINSEADNVFRDPIGDTQDLYSDSLRVDMKYETLNEKPGSPLEVSEPSIPSMNFQFDSAPPDDISSDEEDNEKENIDPHPHRSANSSPPSGDPVKAFVDEEAEEEDNSDNDLMRFQEDEDEDNEEDAEELNNMIATAYEENPVDKERRDQLHQQWLEQQDAAGMDDLLHKLNCGSKLRDTPLIGEEEDEESDKTENESEEEEEHVAQPNAARVNLEKVRQMIPQMFSDKDDAYVSSDDEETQKRPPKRFFSSKITEKTMFLSPAEDESSREVFSLIKKLNTVPDTKRKGRTSAFFDTPLIGQSINVSSKSSFLNRVSNRSWPSSQKHGTNKARSFIFGRDDSNSRTSISLSEDSSDKFQTESQPPKSGGAKHKSNTQNGYQNSNSTSQKPGTCLLEKLRESSRHAECVQNYTIQQTESVFAAFKIEKKPI